MMYNSFLPFSADGRPIWELGRRASATNLIAQTVAYDTAWNGSKVTFLCDVRVALSALTILLAFAIVDLFTHLTNLSHSQTEASIVS
jgi:hypothetical protein